METKEILCCEKHGLEIRAKTVVYYNGDSQEDKRQARHLKSLSDPLVLDVVNFYSTLPVLEGIGRLVNQEANEYLKITDAQQLDHAGIRLRSALRVMLEEIEKYQRNLDELCAKLPN